VRRERPWYKHKPDPTFADMLATCRYDLWSEWLKPKSGSQAELATKRDWMLRYWPRRTKRGRIPTPDTENPRRNGDKLQAQTETLRQPLSGMIMAEASMKCKNQVRGIASYCNSWRFNKKTEAKRPRFSL
jgi:hypothetical protein